MSGLEGRVAAITGGGGAICGAIAATMAARGAAVAVWDLREAAAERVAAAIRETGRRALGVGCDVLDREGVARALEVTERELGPVDTLINGAGGSRPEATTSADLPFFDILPRDLMGTVELNYLSAVLPSQAVGRGFAARGRGVILNIASIAGLRPLTRSLGYSNGKAALVSFTEWLAVHMAREYSTQIRVNALAPGFVLTEQNRFLLLDERGGPTERGRMVTMAVPMGRYGSPQEIAEAAVWLVSDAASFVTGAVLPVDGGYSAAGGV